MTWCALKIYQNISKYAFSSMNQTSFLNSTFVKAIVVWFYYIMKTLMLSKLLKLRSQNIWKIKYIFLYFVKYHERKLSTKTELSTTTNMSGKLVYYTRNFTTLTRLFMNGVCVYPTFMLVSFNSFSHQGHVKNAMAG